MIFFLPHVFKPRDCKLSRMITYKIKKTNHRLNNNIINSVGTRDLYISVLNYITLKHFPLVVMDKTQSDYGILLT